MALTERIIQHLQMLPELRKAEVLDFIEYLELKGKKDKEDALWPALSLDFAMRDMKNEPSLYDMKDLKEFFS